MQVEAEEVAEEAAAPAKKASKKGKKMSSKDISFADLAELPEDGEAAELTAPAPAANAPAEASRWAAAWVVYARPACVLHTHSSYITIWRSGLHTTEPFALCSRGHASWTCHVQFDSNQHILKTLTASLEQGRLGRRGAAAGQPEEKGEEGEEERLLCRPR